jgi:uncharacterized sulfatase
MYMNLINRRNFLGQLSGLCAGVAVSSSVLPGLAQTVATNTQAKNNEKRPNILIIISDDQGHCELGSYMAIASAENLGSPNAAAYRDVKECTAKKAPIDVCFEAARKCMPNMDALAGNGVKFTSFLSAPTCAPARSLLMTGRYPQSFGVYCNDDIVSGDVKGVPGDVQFPVRLFKEAGYMTGLCGKWHLGSKPGQHPNDRGFEYFFGFDRAHTEKYDSKLLQRNGQSVPAKGWLADQISDEAVDFLQRAEKEKRPFFLYVAYNEPHGPTPRPPQKYIDHFKSGSDIVDVHFATIYGMDQGIGRIIAELKRSGRLENTLVVFGSDNGAGAPKAVGFNSPNYNVPVPGNGPFRGGKWTPWEGGVRVPFIACLPNGMGKSSDALVSMMDVLPTALEYAGIRVPDDHKLDGRSFLSVLQGKNDGDPERMLFWAGETSDPFPGGEWNPAFIDLQEKAKGLKKGSFLPCWYVRTPKWKLLGWDTLSPVLIDMTRDSHEWTDVSKQHPEIVAQLTQHFKTWIKTQKEPLFYDRKQWEKFL